MMDNDLALFALNSSREFGEQVAQQLGVSLSRHEEREFEDGEYQALPLVSVRGKDVYVIHSLYGEQGQSGNDKLCQLLFFIGGLKDAAAARVTAVTPYLAYARKDQKNQPRDPVITRYVAAMFEAVGSDAVVTMDVHNLAAFQNAFRCHTEHLVAIKLFVDYFAPLLHNDEVVVVSPDAGGIKRTDRFRKSLSKALGRPVGAAFAEKYRSEEGIVSGGMLMGDVKKKQAIILDDMISTGTTIVRAAAACRDHGAVKVVAAASHGLFRGDANTILAEKALEQIIVTDTVPPFGLHADEVKSKLTVLRSSALFAEAIHRMHTGGSVSELLES